MVKSKMPSKVYSDGIPCSPTEVGEAEAIYTSLAMGLVKLLSVRGVGGDSTILFSLK